MVKYEFHDSAIQRWKYILSQVNLCKMKKMGPLWGDLSAIENNCMKALVAAKN